MNCERSTQLQAFHDGELSADQRDALERHLPSCAECSELLNDLRGLSRMFASAQMTEISPIAMERLRQRKYVLPDTGVLKIASWLTTAAAAVLLAALPVWHRDYVENSTQASTDTLDIVAVTPPGDTENSSHNEVVALAQWMADDLSGTERH